ncbi:hypothetical protein A2962_01205 [Candidatus Woesebacteria bacterium RIFCSPLOWO2_01_FULL_39_61]|uniref:Phage holin family protein n=1 Tax=Candidatus Woesebacteria bacterium RIFCSPHIGHO2_02_FULL_39_13 TaxID=1802505 RepID=A0A1F7YXC5_9BACT|nr:MAG: hypothetical protein A2692_02995 [Candidatus Woesebacteria bacterium RIFCSPHIGHO2_01_FULL_39_95]OGM31880.1 MAG: hypothetical protein A3D01_05375 [Candidatus Woesebacteria bacterium RIFCSPHIGHO2_02_FULL_39_13]OGM39043.1 MAG: hypothetical protein A3E13_00285 [Candidatus Woesebacteria bacterium RIFCSPHIGHO2_12_FULL_40_20]OGM67868.1 MAG: hypothetical protein A2962_01205 [Candidatus Woesebacteria bacterium RIFCSPLOWO2_01_FULL_39_61]OGM72283.1 MAG: hypothetical protein A3H19_00050 [Candidatus
MKLIIRLATSILALYIVDYLIPGFDFKDFWAIVVTAIVIGVINTFIKPILQLIALPISILTFGIAAFLINVFLLWLASSIVPGFYIANFTTAAIASIVLSLVSWFLHKLASE